MEETAVVSKERGGSDHASSYTIPDAAICKVTSSPYGALTFIGSSRSTLLINV